VDTAVETCGEVPEDVLLRMLPDIDLLFFDVKHLDRDIHQRGTGRGNERILKNIENVAKGPWARRLQMRLTLVPGFNDDAEHLEALGRFAVGHGIPNIEVLPFHRLGASKYEQLGMSYGHRYDEATSEDGLKEAVSSIERGGDVRAWVAGASWCSSKDGVRS